MSTDPKPLSADQVLAGLYAWLGANQWFLKDTIDHADLTAESAAHEAILMLARGDHAAYKKLPAQVRALALRLTLDFLGKLMGPLSKARWPIASPGTDDAALQRAAWQAIEYEIARSSRPPAAPH